MNLNDQQKVTVRRWIDEGLKVSEIQDKLASEFDLRMTYMDLRFLLDDLRLQPKDAETAPEPVPVVPSTPTPNAAEPASDAAQAPGDVTVTVDQVTRPGALVSGRVNFSDGKTAEWYLDQTGRIGLAPSEPGYKPSQADLMLFQGELQRELGRIGY